MEKEKSKVLSVRLQKESIDKIEFIANRIQRKKNWLIQRAVDELIRKFENQQ